jgi:tetratricopeptide (TPR) repeat protein
MKYNRGRENRNKFKWESLLDNEASLQDIMSGEIELPPYSGDSRSSENFLHHCIMAAIHLFRGEFETAGKLLAEIQAESSGLSCPHMALIWLKAEIGDPEAAWKEMGEWMDRAAAGGGRAIFSKSARRMARLDRRLAQRWAPVLRYYLATLLNGWPDEILSVASADRERAVANRISENILVRIDFLLRFARARQEKSVEKVIAAVEEWRRLCKEKPQFGDGSEYLLEAAVALEFEERYADALNWLNQGLALNPEQYDLLLVKARILKQTGDLKASLAVCDKLVLLFPNDFSGYCLRSNIFFMTGAYGKAMADAHKACEVAPENPNSFMARAFVQMQLGNYDQALQDFEQTLRYDPQRYDALRGQGKCLSMLGRDYEALASFNALRRTYPDDPDLYYELADVLFSAGYLDDCEKVCQKCLELDAGYVSALVILGMIALRRDQDEKARDLLTRAVAMEPDHPFALNELAYLNHLQGDDDTALDLVNRALEETPEYADALCNKGVILYFRSDFEQSADLFSQTLQQVPDHVSAWVGKGNSLTQLCEFDEAMRCFDKALRLDPENAEACHGKAVLYRMMGLDDEVRKWQERAYSLDLDGQDE